MRPSTRGLCAAALAVLLTPALSSAADKLLGSMVQPGPPGYNRDTCHTTGVMVPGAAFVNGVSTAKFKFTKKCIGLIVLNKLMSAPLSDGIVGTGDETICFINFQSNTPGPCGTFVLRGEIVGNPTAQKVKIKLNGPLDLPGVCPLAPGSDARVTSVECYAPDPGFVASAACPGVFTPLASDATSGLCFPAGAYVPNPASPIFAVQGVAF